MVPENSFILDILASPFDAFVVLLRYKKINRNIDIFELGCNKTQAGNNFKLLKRIIS